jgi:hypothetical protein
MQRRAAVRLARALWIAWAIVVWNVVFDHVIVSGGRSYLYTAARITAESTRGGHPRYAKVDNWMRPAVTRAFWTASAAAVAILATGMAAIRAAARAPRENALQPTRLAP